jgi:competence CoiA-like predicted nuclease
MSSHAIIFSDDGGQQVVCPAADVRIAETPKDANDVIQAYRNEKAEGTVFNCFDCFKAHGFRIPVVPKLGDILSPHFSHEPGHDKNIHKSAARSNGRITEHHTMGVAEVVARLKEQDIPELDIAENVVSKNEDVNLRPDIVATMQDGSIAAYEIQYSPIQIDRLKARTLGMLQFGYSHVHWYLYPKAYTNENRFFLNSISDVSFYWMQAEKNPP